MTRTSAGLLVFRVTGDGTREVLLVHPGGPLWRKKDDGAWSIPKGEVEADDDPAATADREYAEELGFRIKLLGIARLTEHGLEQHVHPCMVRRETPIAAVEGVFNGIVAEGDFVGQLMLEGRAAGTPMGVRVAHRSISPKTMSTMPSRSSSLFATCL